MDQTDPPYNFPLFWTRLVDGPPISAWTSRKIDLESLVAHVGFSGPLFRMNQVHGNHVQEVTPDSPRVLENTDALVTRYSGLGLVVKTADCVPIMIATDTGWGAVIHAGRRGTQLRITQTVLRYLADRVKPESKYHIWIGPHICAACYEINPDTHETYDLKSENIKQIQEVLPPNGVGITVFDGCTACQTDRFFSYRKEADRAGRMFGLLVM